MNYTYLAEQNELSIENVTCKALCLMVSQTTTWDRQFLWLYRYQKENTKFEKKFNHSGVYSYTLDGKYSFRLFI